MRLFKLYSIYILASIFITISLSGWLSNLVPRDPIDWMFTAPLLLCPLPALFFSYSNKPRFYSIMACSLVTYSGFIWYFADGFFQAGYWLTWAIAAIVCFKFRQKHLLITTSTLLVFGAIMLGFTGFSIPETTPWSVAWNLLYQVVWAPAFVLWMIEHDPKAEAQVSRESKSREHRAAA